ncbi:MAG: hypothetical protein J6R31_05260 [Rikenellaceae bacterium]|nr:hypothetical protein [Rikenellaceae bacterium]
MRNQPILTAAEVVAQAFPATSNIRAAQITEADIVAAQEKFMAPVFGSLWDALCEGAHADFAAEYIKPALAHFVKAQVLPTLGAITPYGVVEHTSESTKRADDRQLARAIRAAADTAQALRKMALRHIEAHIDEFGEYQPTQNILRHTRIAGGVVL